MDLKSVSTLHKALLEEIKSISSEEALESFRLKNLSRQGQLAELMKQLKACSPEEKRELGPALQSLKKEITEAFQNKSEALRQQALEAGQNKQKHFDITAQKNVCVEVYIHTQH